MATPHEGHAVAVLDGKLYAVGGYNDDDGHLSSVERYDPALDAWEAVAPMAEARQAHGMAVLDGKLYAVGRGRRQRRQRRRRRPRLAQLGGAVRPGAERVEAGTPIRSARAGHCIALL